MTQEQSVSPPDRPVVGLGACVGRHAPDQLRYLGADLRAVVKGRRSRWFTLVFSESFAIIAFYRFNRMAYLALGRWWSLARGLIAPIMPLLRLVVTSEIDYRADLGPGLRVLHPQLGLVIGARVRSGRNLILAGGNVLGDGAPTIGDDVQLGANASVIGDVTIGDQVTIGAGAVVVKDFAGPGLLVGVPASPPR